MVRKYGRCPGGVEMKNLITCLTVCVLSGATFATTWTVDDNGKADFDNIQAAVDAASDGDTILIAEGIYPVNSAINANGKAITIRGWTNNDGSPAVTIDGQQSTRVIYSDGDSSDTVFENLIIANGQDGDGGGMRIVNGSPTFTNCTFEGNTCTNGTGGGVYAVGTVDGAVPCNSLFTNCRFENNHAISLGGAVFTRPGNNLIFDGCFFANNTATDSGAGVYSESDSTTFFNCTFESNVANEHGGGIVVNNTITVLDWCSFINNIAVNYSGGAVSCFGGSATITDCVFEGNSAGDHAGGLKVDGVPLFVLDRCLIANNSPSGMRFTGCESVLLRDCMVEGNTDNGGISLEKQTIMLEDTMVTGNSGGIRCNGGPSLTILTRSRVCGNSQFQINCKWQNAECSLVITECLGDCPDVTDDGLVNVQDILTLIAAWESCTALCDLNFDGIVNVHDLLLLIGAWGPCE